MEKKVLAVLFGGQSSEHEVSCRSAITIIGAVDQTKYELLLVGITQDGRWLLADSVEDIGSGAWRQSEVQAILVPDRSVHGLLLIKQGQVSRRRLDLVFPVLHGLYGEDGTVQGLLELAGIPYVGCGVLASAVSMDKFYTKVIVDRLGICQAQYEPVLKEQLADMDRVIARVEARFTYPVFVKPSNAGSSKGVSKACSREELAAALLVAAAEDYKILVEETIVGRELECAVLGGSEARASGVGEILAADTFYSYDAKYNNAASVTDTAPVLPAGKEEEIREAAVKIFRAVDGLGLSRVDFFLEAGTDRVVFNEINTLPGFTSISMYPMLWNARGIDTPALVERLLDTALLRERMQAE